MPKQIKKRVQKKKVATEVEVKDRLATFMDTLQQRQKTLVQYGIVILVIIIAIISFFIYSSSQRKTAKQLEYEAYKIYYNEYQVSPIPEQERYEKALTLFEKSYKTKNSPRLLLYIASCHYELGRYDDALNTLTDFTKRYSNEHALIPLAYVKTAQVYQKKGEMEEALKTYNTFSNFKSNLFKDFTLMESGRMLEREGKLQEAKKKFNEIITRFPNSPFSEEARTKLSEERKS